MLDAMRKNSQSIIIYILFGIIIVVFTVSFGPGSQGCGAPGTGAGYAVVVDGKVISERSFHNEYTGLLQQYRQFDPQFDTARAKLYNLRSRAVDTLVDRALLTQAAHERGLAVSDAKVRELVMKDPSFQTDGKFDFDTYERFTGFALGLSPARYEDQMRDRLLAQQMIGVLTHGLYVSDDEIRAQYDEDNDKVNLSYVRIDPAQLKNIPEPTDEEVTAWEKDNAAAIAAHYEKNKTKFDQPKQVKARHILFKLDEKATKEQEDAVLARAKPVLEEALKGGDFAELAKKSSEGPTADKGGDLGFIGPGAMVKPFEDVAFAMEPGTVHKDLVRSSFGYHIIKVEEVKAAAKKTLAEASHEIAKELVTAQRKKDKAREVADALQAKLAAGGKVDELLTENPYELKLEETGAFSKVSRAVPRIGLADDLKKDAFELTVEGGPGKKVYEVNDRLFVVALKTRTKPDDAEFAKKKEELRETALRLKQSRVVKEWLESRRKKTTIDTNPQMLLYPDDGSAPAAETDAG